MLTIVEIITEAQQGITRPYLCRADDGELYFVKRANAGRKALIAEWVAGNLAARMGLPVPRCAIVEVPKVLTDLLPAEQRREWGTAPLFASQVVDGVIELCFTNLAEVTPRLQAEVLLFDCWVGNSDRTLGEKGGNPNMLWANHTKSLTIIDHNLAFESTSAEVRQDHAFGQAATEWDLVFLDQWPQRLAAAAGDLDAIWRQIPDIWIEEDAGRLSLERVAERLSLFTDPRDPVWSIT